MILEKINDILLAYPIGSIYMSVNNTDPGDLFGGEWDRIQGKFLLSATDNGNSGASQAAGNTGGEASVTLTSAQSGVPQHTHPHTNPTVAQHAATECSQTTNVGISNHGHTITQPVFTLPNHVHSDSHTHATGDNSQTSFCVTYPGDSGGITRHTVASGSGAANMVRSAGAIGRHVNTAGRSAANTGNPTSLPNCTRSTNVAISDHGHTITQPVFKTPVLTHSVSGGSVNNNTAANASEAHNNMPPYLAVYMWKRVA